MAARLNPVWPVLTRYDSDHLGRVALPLGGIGTGTVSLGGRGDLRDWEIVNRPGKGFVPRNTFFAIRAKATGREPVTRALEGTLEPPYEGMRGCSQANWGLPRFRDCSFVAAYPLGQVLLSDPDVRIEAFNPLLPGDADASGIPVAVLRFVLLNKTGRSVGATVCGSLQNFVGTDGLNASPRKNVNTFRAAPRPAKLQGIFMSSEGVEPSAEQWGTIALATTAAAGVTYRTAWPNLSWSHALLDFWDDFSQDGKLDNRDGGGVDAPHGSLAVRVRVPARGERAVTFLLTWHFPNRQRWLLVRDAQCCDATDRHVGNYYTTQYRDAWDVAVRTAPALPRLEADTLTFVRSFCRSDLPAVVKEAALYNLSTLRTQTCFRTANGMFFGWEGCDDGRGCCPGSCTHVWNYEQATPMLFGELACKMREVEFLHATRDDGLMRFRACLAVEHDLAAADGQMGCVMKLYRDWQLSGDDAMLRRLWPRARKTLEFCWIPGGWDADRDGVMEGCQHNTLDVEYYGPNPLMGAWYLGALRAAEEMARYLAEDEFAATCRELFERGRRWIDENLFNGEYYEHQVRAPGHESAIAPGLRHPDMGARDLRSPEFQLGKGCLVDQLVGQCVAHVCGLGHLLDRRHVRQTLRSVMKHNFRHDLYDHLNYRYAFALNDESAMVMVTYPRGGRPERPVPGASDIMTGFEYAAAVHMLYEGQIANGLKAIAAIRGRYDGRRRNPFDEAECGHHYARAMASWAAVLALTGFRYSGVTQTMEFAAADRPAEVFWSNGYAWGTCRQKPTRRGMQVDLTVLHGTLMLKRFALTTFGSVGTRRPRAIRQGRTVRMTVGVAQTSEKAHLPASSE